MNVQVTSGLIGHNNPPVEIEPTPFEMSEVEIGDLYAEAKAFSTANRSAIRRWPMPSPS